MSQIKDTIELEASKKIENPLIPKMILSRENVACPVNLNIDHEKELEKIFTNQLRTSDTGGESLWYFVTKVLNHAISKYLPQDFKEIENKINVRIYNIKSFIEAKKVGFPPNNNFVRDILTYNQTWYLKIYTIARFV